MSEETYNSDDAKCPYCGYVNLDSWELGDGDGEECGETECGECEKRFLWSRRIAITFVCYPVKEDAK